MKKSYAAEGCDCDMTVAPRERCTREWIRCSARAKWRWENDLPVLGRRRIKPIVRFELPLDACLPQNRTSHGRAWQYARDKKRVATLMGMQARRPPAPLPGRPRVVCTRYSSTEPDKWSDWAKSAVDVLTLPTARAPNRLGFLRDDRPKDAEIVQRWEYAAPKKGKCVIEVFAEECGLEQKEMG